MKLQIICKGSTKIGLGHLFRTRTFCKAIRDNAEINVIAIIEEGLESIFFDIIELVTFVYDEKNVFKKSKSYSPDVLIFDLTHISNEIFNKIVEIPKLTVSISPIFNQMQNINILFTRTKYYKPLPNVITYGGLEYSIFNESCEKISDIDYKKNLKKPHLTVAISMGGTDSPNKTLKVIKAFENFPMELTLWVALGEGYAHSYNDLVEAIKNNHKHEIILAKANRSTWDILGNSVLAILAGGLTTIEAVYAGLPSINIFEKKEHFDAAAKELFEKNIIFDKFSYSEESLNLITEKVAFLYNNREVLLKMRGNSKKVIDKKGSLRVFKIIKKHVDLLS